MNKQEIAEMVLEELAEEYSVDLSSCDSLKEKNKRFQEVVEKSDDIGVTDQVEIKLTMSINFTQDLDSYLWSEWWEYAQKDLTRRIADDGVGRSLEIEDAKLNNNWG